MFGLFKRKVAGPLSGPSASSIRTDTRTVIRVGNAAETIESAAIQSNSGVASRGDRPKDLTCAENQLARSVSLAIPRNVSIQIILSDVIGPVVRDAVVVSKVARESIARAVSMADRS